MDGNRNKTPYILLAGKSQQSRFGILLQLPPRVKAGQAGKVANKRYFRGGERLNLDD